MVRWRKGEKAPWGMARTCDAAVANNTVYYVYDVYDKIYCAYHIPSSSWYQLPPCPHGGFALTVIDSLLTVVGGWGSSKLLSLTGEGIGIRWTEKFPPMPTERNRASALCTGTALIVAGGEDDDHQTLKTVEVLNIETWQRHTAPDLPEPLAWSSLTRRGDLLYLLGGFGAANSVYSVLLINFTSFIHCLQFTRRASCKYTDTIQRRQPMKQSCWPPRISLHCCESSWSTASNWWDGFKTQTQCSCSYVPANH